MKIAIRKKEKGRLKTIEEEHTPLLNDKLGIKGISDMRIDSFN